MTALLAALARDPGARRRRWAVVGLALGVLGGLGFAMYRTGEQHRNICSGGASRFAGVWDLQDPDSARRQAIKGAFLGTHKAFAAQAYASVAQLLDDYVSRWVGIYRDACEATAVRGQQSQETLNLRMACLDARVANVRALTDVFALADAGIVTNAVGAANALPPLESCANDAAFKAVAELPKDPTARARIASLRADLARLTAQRDAGRCQVADELGTRLISAVRATGYRPLLAETLKELSSGANFCVEATVAIARAKEAYREAIAAADDRGAAFAAVQIPYLAVDRLSDASLAEEWIGIARATADRLGGDGRLAAQILDAETFLTRLRGPPDAYLSMTRKDLELTREVLGPNHPFTLGGLVNIGEALEDLGRFEDALTQFRLARRESERVLGRDHPQVAWVIADECRALDDLGRYREARETCAQALAIFESQGVEDEVRSACLTSFGVALLGLNRPDQAIVPLERALAAEIRGRLTPRLVGETRFALARALWSRASAHPRALKLARLAREDRVKDTGAVEAIERWLESPR